MQLVGQKLNENDLCVLMEGLNNIRAKWNNLGLQLGVSVGALNAIKKDYNSTSDCLRETLTTWLKTCRLPPTWSDVVDALRSGSVGEVRLAVELEQKYCSTQDKSICPHVLPALVSQAYTQTTPPTQSTIPPTQLPVFASAYTATPPSHPPPWSAPYYNSPHTRYSLSTPFLLHPPTSGAATTLSYLQLSQVSPTSCIPFLPTVSAQTTTPKFSAASPHYHTQGVEHQVESFERKFGSLIHKAYQEVIRQMEPPEFLSHITYLPVSARTLHRSFIKNDLTNIPPPVTYERIWATLNTYWDFLNYGFLEHVINKCGSPDLIWQMQKYVSELSTFKQRTRVCDFINSWPCRKNSLPKHCLKELVVKMKHEWSQCTLQDVESFMKDLVHKFFLPEFDNLLQKAERGCVCVVTWLTSPSIATLLQQNLANIETTFFKKHAIDAVIIDGHNIYLTPVTRYSSYLRDLYNSEQCPVGIGSPTSAEKLLPFKLATIMKEKVSIDEFTRQYL